MIKSMLFSNLATKIARAPFKLSEEPGSSEDRRCCDISSLSLYAGHLRQGSKDVRQL